MLIIAAILIFVAILVLWFGKPWIMTYGGASYRRVLLTPEQISAAAGRLAVALATGLVILALILAGITELLRHSPR